MGRFIARRVLFFVLTLWITSVLVFLLTRVLPGDVARVILGREASAEAVAAKRAELGLDRPLIVQYGDWAANFVTGDWGQGFSGAREDIRTLVGQRLVHSGWLALLMFLNMVDAMILIPSLVAVFRPRFVRERKI